jgi:hydrogenase maturation protease
MDILILGIGNTLLSDEGVGVRLATALAADGLPDGVRVVDGGTIGLALAPVVERAGALLVLDAARMGAMPGTLRLVEGAAFDAFLQSRPATPHDVGLADLVRALALSGTLPPRRALLAVEPERLSLGDALSPSVEAALPAAQATVRELLARWGGT